MITGNCSLKYKCQLLFEQNLYVIGKYQYFRKNSRLRNYATFYMYRQELSDPYVASFCLHGQPYADMGSKPADWNTAVNNRIWISAFPLYVSFSIIFLCLTSFPCESRWNLLENPIREAIEIPVSFASQTTSKRTNLGLYGRIICLIWSLLSMPEVLYTILRSEAIQSITENSNLLPATLHFSWQMIS
jgi:hypothetical protein